MIKKGTKKGICKGLSECPLGMRTEAGEEITKCDKWKLEEGREDCISCIDGL